MFYPNQGLNSLTQIQLENWVTEAKKRVIEGRLPHYIPRLSQANPQVFAVQIQTLNQQIYQVGQISDNFPLMSVIKPFNFLFLLESLGKRRVFASVGMQPSEYPFNSLEQLQLDQGFPRNPMINSGAIALAALLPGETARIRCETLQKWLNQKAKTQLFLDEAMLASVRSVANAQNQKLTQILANEGYLASSVKLAIETYESICCLSGTVADLAQLGLLLIHPEREINSQNSRIVKAIMLTCGLYEYSAQFAVEVGLPSKSGVSGVLLSLVPGQGAIACYSPPLDNMGNSCAGLYLLQQLAQQLNLSIFD